MNDNKLQAKGFVVWIICALFFLYEFFLRIVIGTYQHPIMYDLDLTSFQFSLLSTTIFFLIYGIMQIPVGLIVDNIGLKKSLIIGATFCAVSSIGLAYSNHYYLALAYRMLMGFSAAFGFICLLVSVHDWMPHKYSAIFIGMSQFIGTLGPMIATGPLESVASSANIDWRYIFIILGILGVILIFLILFFVENNHQKAGEYTVLYKSEKISVSIKRLFARVQPWYIAFLSTALYFSIEYLSENEGRAFLALKGVSEHSAGYMLTIAWIGYAIGCPLLGFISDIFERRRVVLRLSAFLALISMLMILHLSGQIYLQVGFFILGISAAGQSVGFATIAEQFKKQFVAVGFGLNNAIITTVAAINAPTIGLLLDRASGENAISLENYLSVFNILIAIAVIGIILSMFFVKETYCKSMVDFTVLKTQPKK